jgi:hypothetical protein
MPLDLNDPEVKAFAEKLRTEITGEFSGLVTKNAELLDESKKIKTKLKEFDGIDVTVIKNLQTRFENDAEFKLIQEGKVDEVLNKRFEKMRLEYDGKITALNEDLTLTANARDTLAKKYAGERISAELRTAAAKAGVTVSATDDVLLRGTGFFSLDDDGSIVARNADGSLKTDAKGKQITADSFVEGLRETHPHYWGTSTGAGYQGGQGGLNDLEKRMIAAADAGDLGEYNRLKAERAKATAK